jgi:hypothetical protein
LALALSIHNKLLKKQFWKSPLAQNFSDVVQSQRSNFMTFKILSLGVPVPRPTQCMGGA